MKLNQFDTLVLDEFEEDKFHLPTHSHTYYELIYIVKGSGVHHLNDNLLTYSQGDLFALSPDDHHWFDIKSSTRFIFIKFTDSYFSSKKNLYTDDMLTNTRSNLCASGCLRRMYCKWMSPAALFLKTRYIILRLTIAGKT